MSSHQFEYRKTNWPDDAVMLGIELNSPSTQSRVTHCSVGQFNTGMEIRHQVSHISRTAVENRLPRTTLERTT
jgi:hypothetical protein